MIRHLVLWRLKETAHGNDRATNARIIKERLEALAGRIPGLVTIEVGIDFSNEETSAHVGLCSEFVDRESLAGYAAHPEHRAVMAFIAEARSERRVVDYEIAD